MLDSFDVNGAICVRNELFGNENDVETRGIILFIVPKLTDMVGLIVFIHT